jgi:hypothetical protein
MELTVPFISRDTYQTLEKYSGGPSFHLYIFDFDKDGYLDIALPNFINNTLVYLRNPGSTYWRKVGSIVYQANKQKIQNDLKAMEKWRQIPIIQSAYSDTIKDFILVNIDSENKLVVVVLSTYSISKLKKLVWVLISLQ